MANTVKIKRSAVSGKVPLTTDLELGELALNTFDGKLYTKKDNGTVSIIQVGAGDFVGPASSTDNAIVRFDGTTGKLVQNSGVVIDDNGNVGINTASGAVASSKLVIGSTAATASDVNLRTTQTDFAITPSNTAAGGVTIATSWVSGGQGPLIFTNSGGEIIRFSGNRSITITRKIVPNVQSVVSAATITPNADTDSQVSVTALAVAATIAIPSGTASDGQRLMIRFEDNGTARALTWTTTAGGYREVGLTLPTTTTATKVLYVGCVYNALDGFWDVIAKGEQA